MIRYDNSNIRRQDRLLSEERALELLRNSDFGVLSLLTEEGLPYGIPVNYVWNGDNIIYIHCAPEGRKLRCIAMNHHASFCIIGETDLLPHKFTTNYESIIISCDAEIGLSPDERISALHLLIEKYSSAFREIGKKYAIASFNRTEIIKLNIKSISGKSKNISR